MKKTSLLLISAILFLSSFTLFACKSEDAVTTTAPVAKIYHEQELLDEATENILTAMDDRDYESFIADFSEQMLTYFPEDEFTKFIDIIAENSGKYLSKKYADSLVDEPNGYITYFYDCEFEKETVRASISFKLDDNKVEGFYLYSKNLEAAAAEAQQ